MNRQAKLTNAGGLKAYQDTVDFLQLAYSQPLDAISTFVGNKVIVFGCADQGATLAAGWISFNGEILPFTGGLKAPYIIVEEIVTNEQYEDNQQRPFYTVRRLKFGNAVGALGGFAAADLKPISSNAADISTAFSSIEAVLKAIAFENEVILSGCTVTVAASVAITAGTAMFSGKVISVPAYSGAAPVYLKSDGNWTTALPAGSYIKFDPHTSQRYKDVLRRQNYQSGDILFSKIVSDRFDSSTGIGKWEWLGFKLSEDMRGRVPVGFWFGDSGAADVYDEEYRDYAFGGKNKHTITQAELPAYNLKTEVIGDNGYPRDSGDRGSSNQYLLSPTAANKSNRQLNVSSQGGGQSHDIRQPYRVVAILERI